MVTLIDDIGALIRQTATDLLNAVANSQLLIMQRLDKLERNLMHTNDEILSQVQDQSTLVAGVSTAMALLRQNLADALAGVNIPPDVQDKIDRAFDGLEANKKALASALATGPDGKPVPPTPVVPPPAP